MFNFKMIHVPGVLNKVADTASRFPGKERLVMILQLGATPSDIAEIEEIESLEKSLSAELASAELCQAITNDRVRKETEKDPLLIKLMDKLIKAGGTGSKSSIETWDEELEDYKSVKNDLRVQDGVLFYKHRFVIPETLRNEVLNVLHSAYQGVTGMKDRATGCVWWPRINQEIQSRRRRCTA